MSTPPATKQQSTWTGLSSAFMDTLVIHAPGEHDDLVREVRAATPTLDADPGFNSPKDVLKYGRLCRDEVVRVGAITAMDSQNRISLRRVLRTVGWDEDTELVTQGNGHGVVLRLRATGDGIRTVPAALDSTGRLVLTCPVRSWLEVCPGDRVHVTAVPTEGRIHLHSEQDILTALTGSLTPPCQHKSPIKPKSHTSRIRKARYLA